MVSCGGAKGEEKLGLIDEEVGLVLWSVLGLGEWNLLEVRFRKETHGQVLEEAFERRLQIVARSR